MPALENRSPLCAVAIAAILAAGCSSSTQSSKDPENPARQSQGEEKDVQDTRRAALPLPRGRDVSFEMEMERVSEIRGLPNIGSLRGLEVERDELLAHVTRAVQLEMPEKALLGTEAMLIELGLVPRDFNYRETMLRLLSSKLAGLYDPHLKAMLIRAQLSPGDREMTLLHELVHALQDQHYDVMDVVEWEPDDTDRSGALSALAEGDATSAMFDGMMPEGKTALSLPPGFIQERMRADVDAPEGVPSIIHRSLKASYIDGLTFVHQLRHRGGFAEVDKVWKRPPVTTEQVLHLDKYDSAEAPLAVPVPGPPSSEHELILHDTWGEQNLRLVFEEWLPREKAEEAARGWGGDRIVTYNSERGGVTIWHLRGDDAAAAERHFRAFEVGLSHEKEAFDSEQEICGRRSEQSPWLAVVRRGSDLFLSGSPVGPDETPRVQCLAAIGYLETQF